MSRSSDKEHFKKLGQVMNQRLPMVPRKALIKAGRLEDYLNFIDEGHQMVRLMKGSIVPPPSEGVEIGHEKALRLRLLNYGTVHRNQAR